jgi:hypothetical protein
VFECLCEFAKRPRRCRCPNTNEFCRFRVGDIEFAIEEPFGDNSRYLVYAKPPRAVTELASVRESFLRASPWKFIF